MSNNKCREAYEQWLKERPKQFTEDGIEYKPHPADAWQAAWNTSREEAAKEATKNADCLAKHVTETGMEVEFDPFEPELVEEIQRKIENANGGAK